MSPISDELPELNFLPRRASDKSDMIEYFASGDFQAGILAQSRKLYAVVSLLCIVSIFLICYLVNMNVRDVRAEFYMEPHFRSLNLACHLRTDSCMKVR